MISVGKALGIKVLDVDELLDINIRKFERENNVKINFTFSNMMVQFSEGKTSRSKSESKSKSVKQKHSDLHLNVGLGKRVDPFEDQERKVSKSHWENINFKKDHVLKFSQKDENHRVL